MGSPLFAAYFRAALSASWRCIQNGFVFKWKVENKGTNGFACAFFPVGAGVGESRGAKPGRMEI